MHNSIGLHSRAALEAVWPNDWPDVFEELLSVGESDLTVGARSGTSRNSADVRLDFFMALPPREKPQVRECFTQNPGLPLLAPRKNAERLGIASGALNLFKQLSNRAGCSQESWYRFVPKPPVACRQIDQASLRRCRSPYRRCRLHAALCRS